MHFSVYYRLVDLLWDHLSDEELFRRLAREALERYIDYKKEEEKIEERNKLRVGYANEIRF